MLVLHSLASGVRFLLLGVMSAETNHFSCMQANGSATVLRVLDLQMVNSLLQGCAAHSLKT